MVQHRCLKYLPFYENLTFLKWVRKILMFSWFQVIVRGSALSLNLTIFIFSSDPITEEPLQKTNMPRKLSMALTAMACWELYRKAFGQAFILSLSILSWMNHSQQTCLGGDKQGLLFLLYPPFCTIYI